MHFARVFALLALGVSGAAATIADKYFAIKAVAPNGTVANPYDNLYLFFTHWGTEYFPILDTFGDTRPTQYFTAEPSDVNGYYQVSVNTSTASYWLYMNSLATSYADMQPVMLQPTINQSVTAENNGFYLSTGAPHNLLWTSIVSKKHISNGFYGWLACTWVHYGAVQLFYKTSNFGFVLPANCAEVDLQIIPVV